MADPWSSDLAALGECSRRNLRTLEATRAALAERPQEIPKMRFFKSHPALAALIALAVLAVAAPIAYAVVREVWISIDPDKPAPEIEKDITTQLEAAGMPGTVHAEKSDDGRLKVSIMHSGMKPEDIGSAVHISVTGETGEKPQHMVRLEVGCALEKAQFDQLTDVLSSDDMVDALKNEDLSDADRAAAIKTVLAAHGFKSVEITTDDEGIHVKVTAPPA